MADAAGAARRRDGKGRTVTPARSRLRVAAYRWRRRQIRANRLGPACVGFLSALYGRRPVPLRAVLLARRLASLRDALAPGTGEKMASGALLRDPELAAMLCSVDLGRWPLDVWTLNWLQTVVRKIRPQGVLEFGSGYSTVCLAHYLSAHAGGGSQPLVYSIEESEEYAATTRAILSECGKAHLVRVIAAPVVEQVVEGQVTRCYDLPPALLDRLMGNRTVSMCVVDGPARRGGSRFGTVPLVKDRLDPGATIVLDDARRDEELRVAAQWSALPYLRVSGIVLVGKGILLLRKL